MLDELFFMLFSLSWGWFGVGFKLFGVPQRSQAPGNPTTGFGLRFSFDTGRWRPAVFTFRFLIVLSFRFTPQLCRNASDASKTSLLSN